MLMKVLSHPCHGNSKCCIRASWLVLVSEEASWRRGESRNKSRCPQHLEREYDAQFPTRLQGAGSAGVTGWAVASRVEGCQSDQVRRVTGQVGEMHTGVWDKNHFDLLGLVLPLTLPVVDLQHKKTLLTMRPLVLLLTTSTGPVLSSHPPCFNQLYVLFTSSWGPLIDQHNTESVHVLVYRAKFVMERLVLTGVFRRVK